MVGFFAFFPTTIQFMLIKENSLKGRDLIKNFH